MQMYVPQNLIICDENCENSRLYLNKYIYQYLSKETLSYGMMKYYTRTWYIQKSPKYINKKYYVFNFIFRQINANIVQQDFIANKCNIMAFHLCKMHAG
jgi:hypothetical protein